MNFLFVDRILALDPAKEILGIKHVTNDDGYLYRNHRGKIALHTSVVSEAIGQLCSWNVIKTTDYAYRLIGGVVGQVCLHSEVLPGETLVLQGYIHQLDLDNLVCHFEGYGKVGQRLVLELKDGLGPIMPIEKFGDVSVVKKDFDLLYRPGKLPSVSVGTLIEQTNLPKAAFLDYDRILAWKEGEYIVAQKNISMTAPFFPDHFPWRSVMPGTLMIQSQLLLGQRLLNKFIRVGEYLWPKVISRVKMNDFVLPGSILQTRVELKAQQDHCFKLQFRTESENKRVCTGEVEFEVKIDG